MYTMGPQPYNPTIPVLLDWIIRELYKIEEDSVANFDMPITTVAPDKPREGMIRYADGTSWNPGSGKGVYWYSGSAWTKM